MRNPEVATDGGVVANLDAAKDGGISIDHHIISDDRMTGNALDQRAVFFLWEVLGSESNALIECHIIAQDSSSTYDDARAMVDGKRVVE